MSVSSISANSAVYPGDSGVTSPSQSSGSTQTSAQDPSAPASSSTRVTLSAGAQAYANLAATGITITQQSLADFNVPQQAVGESSSDYANTVFSATQAALAQHPLTALTQQDFESLVKQFGGTTAQADGLFSSLDTGNTGSLSSAQLLAALGDTSGDPANPASQILLSIMDTDHDGAVSGSEFQQFESAMIRAERGFS
jgi:hypothetical protein